MLRQKNADRFHQHVKDLTLFLRTTFKEDEKLKKLLTLVLQKHRQMDQTEYLNSVISAMDPHYELISQKNEFLFMPEYQKRSIFFLYGLDFKRIWQYIKTDEDKRIVFRFLQLMYIQGNTALGKNKDQVKELAEAIQMEDQIAKDAQENPNMFDDNKFKALFGEDDVLYDLAQDISKEFNLAEMLGGAIDPQELQKAMQNGNPQDLFKKISENPKMKESMTRVAQKTQQKMTEKNLTQDDLMKSFEAMKDNLTKNMKGPMGAQVKKMMKNFDLESMSKNMSQQFGQNPQLFQQPNDQHSNNQQLNNQQLNNQQPNDQQPNDQPPNPINMPPEMLREFYKNLPDPNNPPNPEEFQKLLSSMGMPQIPLNPTQNQTPEPTQQQNQTDQTQETQPQEETPREDSL